jgi:hypothetical protein
MVVELIITNEGSQMVGAAFPAIGNGDRLYRRSALWSGLEQQAMERQYRQTCAGGSFRVYQDTFPGPQIPDDLVPNPAGLTTAASNEERAGLSCQPAYDRPLADLGF